jgi:hypothetical protein
MNRSVLVVMVIIVVAIASVFAFSSNNLLMARRTSTTTQIPESPRVYSEKQMWVTTGIEAWFNTLYPSSTSTTFYNLVTTVRSVTNSLVTNITATLDLTPPFASSVFFQGGLARVTPTVPLGWNQTASLEGNNLTPPPGGFQVGQYIPETIVVTFRNGTSVEFDVSAQVFLVSSA